MLDLVLLDGPGSPLVRGFAVCLSSVTEVAVDELPTLAGAERLAHAVGAWKSWLSGLGSGLVPIADPRSFQWAGWWIAVVDDSPSPLAFGNERQVAVLAFGSPSGVVLSPQDPTLIGQATADLPISSAYAVASLDPTLRPVTGAVPLTGVVERLAVALQAEAEMRLLDSARAIPGRGLKGDRYASNAGTFSSRSGHKPGLS